MGLTGDQLRIDLAKSVGRYFNGTATGGTVQTLIDINGLDRWTETDALKGALLYIIDTGDAGAPWGESEFIKAYDVATNTITLYCPMTASIDSGDHYAIYLAPLDFEGWNDCVDDAILSAWPEVFTPATEDVSPTGALTYALSAAADRVLGAEITFKSALAGYPSQPLLQWYTTGEPGALTLKLSRPVPSSSDMTIRVLTGQKYDALGGGGTPTNLDPVYILMAARANFYQRMADASRQSDRGGFLQLMAHWQEQATQRKAALGAALMGYQQAPAKKEK